MKKEFKNNNGSIMVEAAFAIPILLFLVFGSIELSRMLYIRNALSTAAQQVASLISTQSTDPYTYNLSNFTQYADQIRYPGAVLNSDQFSFDVLDSSNTTTVAGGTADASMSTKVLVTVIFPPPGDTSHKVPMVDPGNLFGAPVFGENGLVLMAEAVCFLEGSRRPVLP